MNRLSITTPITDLDNVAFVRFTGRMDGVEKKVEDPDDILRNMIPVSEYRDLDKERKYRCRFSEL